MSGWTSANQRSAAVKRAAFNVAVLGALGWALVWLFASDRFYVSQIIVQGNQQIPTDSVGRASGLQGYSAFWIHPQRVAAQITGLLPPIASVQVRHGMSNTVTLLVQEQQEQIIWQWLGVRYWVKEDGRLSPVQDEERSVASNWASTAEWTLLVNDVRPAPGPGAGLADTLSVEPDILAGVRQIIRLLPEVRVVEYAPAVGLRYLHPRGWLVYLGTGSDMAYKVNVLRAIEVQFAGKDVVQPTLVDLRYPDSPYYRLPSSALPGSEGD